MAEEEVNKFSVLLKLTSWQDSNSMKNANFKSKWFFTVSSLSNQKILLRKHDRIYRYDPEAELKDLRFIQYVELVSNLLSFW